MRPHGTQHLPKTVDKPPHTSNVAPNGDSLSVTGVTSVSDSVEREKLAKNLYIPLKPRVKAVFPWLTCAIAVIDSYRMGRGRECEQFCTVREEQMSEYRRGSTIRVLCAIPAALESI